MLVKSVDELEHATNRAESKPANQFSHLFAG
jgi:hypothetical protein